MFYKDLAIELIQVQLAFGKGQIGLKIRNIFKIYNFTLPFT